MRSRLVEQLLQRRAERLNLQGQTFGCHCYRFCFFLSRSELSISINQKTTIELIGDLWFNSDLIIEDLHL